MHGFQGKADNLHNYCTLHVLNIKGEYKLSIWSYKIDDCNELILVCECVCGILGKYKVFFVESLRFR